MGDQKKEINQTKKKTKKNPSKLVRNLRCLVRGQNEVKKCFSPRKVKPSIICMLFKQGLYNSEECRLSSVKSQLRVSHTEANEGKGKEHLLTAV